MVWETILHRRRHINHVTCQFLSVFSCFWTWLEGFSGQPACSGPGCSRSQTIPSRLCKFTAQNVCDLTLLTQDCVALQGSGSETLMLPGAQHRGPRRESLPGTASQREVHCVVLGEVLSLTWSQKPLWQTDLPRAVSPRVATHKVLIWF